ncbi:MAG: hypothetical protein Q9219_005327 [cf. Caloplaca sp. 3 TL-2023]
MPLTTASHDSLPCPHSLTSARALITSSLPPPSSQTTKTPHPSLPPLRPSNFTPLAALEQDRVARGDALDAISTSRYELPDPAATTTVSETAEEEQTADLLRQAYASAHYLRHRGQHLELLNRFGKNAWLVGNAQLEDILKGVERELVGVREEVERVNRGRKAQQEAGRGEMEGLEKGWREGVGRCVEVEVEVERLEGRRREVLREGAR